MKRIGILLVPLGLLALPAARDSAAPANVRESVEAGPWRVGFRVLATQYVNSHSGDGAPRPLQISVWYPASKGGSRPMSYRDYVGLTASELAPHAPTSQCQHNRMGKDNADAHLKRQVMGREVVVAITKSKLDFGPWEQIFYGEFDGRRRK